MNLTIHLISFFFGLDVCFKHTAGLDQNRYVIPASIISGNDIEFLALVDAENGLWTPDRKHPTNSNGSNDWGFCGINDYWHKDTVNHPNFFNPIWQLNKCHELYIGGTKFYGKSRTHITRNHFTCLEW